MIKDSTTTDKHWSEDIINAYAVPQSCDALMELVVRLARGSVENDSGPFAALIASAQFDIISIGWNDVVAENDSTWHAEVHAIRLAQKKLNTYDLSSTQYGPLSLFSSCSPCIQCFGVIYWSGIANVYSAATTQDASNAGFDEGPICSELWELARQKKNISFFPEFHRDELALESFIKYRERNGVIYSNKKN